MSKQPDFELLRSLWNLFDVPPADIRKHPIIAEAVGNECSETKDLPALLACVNTKGKGREALDSTLRQLHEEWPQLSVEVRAKILELGKFYPKRIKNFPLLSPSEQAIHSVRWDASDILFQDEQTELFRQIAAAGLDLKTGRFVPPDRINLDIWKQLPELLAPLLVARIECDLVAVSYAAPGYRPECEKRVQMRAEATSNEWYYRVLDAFRGLDADSFHRDLYSRLQARLNPIINGVSGMTPSISRQAKFKDLVFPPLPPPPPPPERTFLERVRRRLEENRVSASVILLFLLASAVLAFLTDVPGWRERQAPVSLQARHVAVVTCTASGVEVPDTAAKDFFPISFSSCTAGDMITRTPHWALKIKQDGDYEIRGEIGWASAPTADCGLHIVRQTGSEGPRDVDKSHYDDCTDPYRIELGPTVVRLKKGDLIWLAVGQHSLNNGPAVLGDDARNKLSIDLLVPPQSR